MRWMTIFAVGFGLMTAAGSAEANGLDAGARAKVMSTLAKTYRDGKAPQGSTVIQGDVVQTGCSGVSIGVVTDSKAAKRLREQVTIVTGDVINAPGRHCRRR